MAIQPRICFGIIERGREKQELVKIGFNDMTLAGASGNMNLHL
jgi:hypothetical protein